MYCIFLHTDIHSALEFLIDVHNMKGRVMAMRIKDAGEAQHDHHSLLQGVVRDLLITKVKLPSSDADSYVACLDVRVLGNLRFLLEGVTNPRQQFLQFAEALIRT